MISICKNRISSHLWPFRLQKKNIQFKCGWAGNQILAGRRTLAFVQNSHFGPFVYLSLTPWYNAIQQHLIGWLVSTCVKGTGRTGGGGATLASAPCLLAAVAVAMRVELLGPTLAVLDVMTGRQLQHTLRRCLDVLLLLSDAFQVHSLAVYHDCKRSSNRVNENKPPSQVLKHIGRCCVHFASLLIWFMLFKGRY